MARSFSGAFLQDMLSQDTGEAILILITIDHADLPSPLRVSSDAVDTTSGGETFVAFPFAFQPPAEPEDSQQTPFARIQISNIDKQIGEALESISSPATFSVSIVRASAPDTIVLPWPEFKLREVRFDGSFVSGDLSLSDYTTEPFPPYSYVPGYCRAMF